MTRLIVAEARTLTVLDWEAPMTSWSATTALSAPGDVTVTLPAAYNANVTADGTPWIIEAGTVLVLEDERGDFHAGLVDQVSLGADLQVSAGGVSMVSKDHPWQGPHQEWISMDALTGWRAIWEYIRTRPAPLPVQLTGDTTCGVRVGRPESAKHRVARLEMEAHQRSADKAAARLAEAERLIPLTAKDLYAITGHKRVGAISTGDSKPSASSGKPAAAYIQTTTTGTPVAVWHWEYRNKNMWVRYTNAQIVNRARAYLDAVAARDAATEVERTHSGRVSEIQSYIREVLPESHADPYTLHWWDTPDLSQNLGELAGLGGFDWVETAGFDDSDRLVLGVHAQSRIGRRHDDLVLELGVNVNTHPELTRGEVRTHVSVLGEGEAGLTLRAESVLNHPRLVARHSTISDRSLRTQQLVDSAANRALDEARHALSWQVSTLAVTEHDLAPLASLAVGDEIRLTGTISDGTDMDMWVRITQMTTTHATDGVEIEVRPA